MQISKTLTAFVATAFFAIAGSPAMASSSNEAGLAHRASAPPANPKDAFRYTLEIPAPKASTETAMKDCDCPMTKAPASKLGHHG